ncbi:polysaccharide deacetylase family protein [Paracrocinitomix mangrovi]|uniref:polysaccharide deacetylase family protein n=1 Tax=Paracrocinitomix mangrovi TaxID=2862509 RepID=UPI001C8F000B|nr:polysaccharide deacetylase family protein [Paracrocinitomix mangrovi]UKN01816.1 polysaccharide deacetylase family protein [Paracrocinitomix mangrovi]
MLAVFSKSITERLKYVLNFCFTDKGIEVQLFDDQKQFEDYDGARLNYSSLPLDTDFAIDPSGLLFENDIDEDLELIEDEGELTIRESVDPLSVIFFIISRYEEYLPHEKDQHGRYLASNSQLYKLDLLKQPVADKLTKKLWIKLNLSYEHVQSKFELVPSFDIDVAWAYKNRPFWRKLGAFSKGKIAERLSVLLHLKKDPYDTYSTIMKIASELNRIICFVPLSDYGPNDKNISWKNEAYRSLIRGLNASGGVGLHPGYASHLNEDKLLNEKERLEEIVGHEMVKSRFHFLRFQIPDNYLMMYSLGFTKDYSMGYAEEVGFRAGTSFPFYFFDLKNNQQTNYLIFPFAYMDNTFKDYLKASPEEAIEEMKSLMDEVKNVGGVFMCIWHNHSINNKGEWAGWYQLLDETVKWSKK